MSGFLLPHHKIAIPTAGEVYRGTVQDLKQALADANPDSRADAFVQIREIVEKIVIHPRGTKTPADIEIHGQLAALLRISEEVQAPEQLRGIGCGDAHQRHPIFRPRRSPFVPSIFKNDKPLRAGEVTLDIQLRSHK